MTKPTNDDIVVSREYEDLRDMAMDVSETEIIMKSNCKLCNSTFRSDAEAMYDKVNNYSAVAQFMNNKGEKISHKAVANHMIHHYVAQEKRIRLKEYASNLGEYMKVKNDKMANIAMMRAILSQELMDIASEPTMCLADSCKKKEMILKIIAQTIAVDDAERKHTEDWRPVHVIIDKLRQLVEAEQQSAPADYNIRLAKVVNTLISDVKGLQIDK